MNKKGLQQVISISLMLFVVIMPKLSFSQTEEEPLWQQLQQNFKSQSLSIGALLQVVGDMQPERSFAGNNGFNISNMRLRIYGELDNGFGYFFQTNFISAPTILDASLSYEISPALAIDAGRFKAPFSAELLTYAGSIDMVNRAQVVSALAPGRQIGVQVRGANKTEAIFYRAGIFNGNNPNANNNDSNGFLYAGRIVIHPFDFKERTSSDRLQIGVNLAYSEDERATLLGGAIRSFRGDRFLVGGDVRWTREKLLLSGEYLYASLTPDSGDKFKPTGFHLTGGYMLNSKSQFLVRWDTFSPNESPVDRNLIILGYNLWPTQASELQVNYIIDTDDGGFEHHQLLINFQLAF